MARVVAERFNTATARNALVLFGTTGFTPTRPSGDPPRPDGPSEVTDEVGGWLPFRYSIAHVARLPASDLVSGRINNGPSLGRADGERRLEFFREVVAVTARAADARFP